MRRHNAVIAFVALLLSPACSAQKLVALMPGVVNDPANRTLRRALLRYGGDAFCAEMTQRSAPLRGADDEPVTGRFFPRQCASRETSTGDVYVEFGGVGYAWTQASQRVGFEASGAVQYNQDFLLDGSTLYAYFRPRDTHTSSFKATMVESVQAMPLGGLLSGAATSVADRAGAQLIDAELARGFTVIRDTNGAVEFAIGVIEKGARPPHPFDVHGSSRTTLANERDEVHAEQRDFLGPFTVDAGGRALFVTAAVEGAPAVDVFVADANEATPWLDAYITRPGASPPPFALRAGDVLATNAPWQARAFAVPKGRYFVIIDNTSSAGRVGPQAARSGFGGNDAATAVVSYAVQLGDAPLYRALRQPPGLV